MGKFHAVHIGNVLVRLRKQKLKSQEQLAEDSGLDPRTIQQLEGNHQQPLNDTLYSLAYALDIHPVEFFRLIHEEYCKNGHWPLQPAKEEGDLS
ncbi:helix-turn-helix transcriptional regulator [Bacillus sp. FJAT-27251]|uniref:helix-turn-helix domain-containing protein n=1 Tax=Bacillus sp. FJAT-27251 TaxID=1684142 RepID=UPI0006A763AA|nr:helix-turn-helix transcriptional regulator [Bacillus sp. FJAT-27251]